MVVSPAHRQARHSIGYALAMIFWSSLRGTALGNSLTSLLFRGSPLVWEKLRSFPPALRPWPNVSEERTRTGHGFLMPGPVLAPCSRPSSCRGSTRGGLARAFLGIGALGFVWLVFWLLIYRKRRSILAYKSGTRLHPRDPRHRRENQMGCLLPLRQTWRSSSASF